MERIKFFKAEIKFHLLLSILFAIFISFASYVHIPLDDSKSLFIYAIHFLILQFSVFGFLYILSISKRIFLVIFPIIFFVLSAISFWVYTQDISINSGMIQAILESNIDIAIDVVSLQFVIFLFFNLLCIIFIIQKHRKLKINTLKSPLFILSIIAIAVYFLADRYRFGILTRKLPYSAFIGVKDYLEKPNLKLREVPKNISTKKDSLHIVFVLGESVRADHLSINGYRRNTTPLLKKQNNVLSFKNIYTPLTYTAISVPQILSDKSILDHRKNEVYSLYSILKKTGFYTEWIGNQSLEKSYEGLVKTNEKILIVDKFHSVLSFKKEKDLVLLDTFKLQNFSTKNKISTLHMIGSHWYYNSRFDDRFKIFNPMVTSKYVGSASKEELINSYDNTILYLDFFLNKLINKLKKSQQETILIYLSDHGETLGEEGQWFHAQRNKASENPAMLVWYSEKFKKKNPISIKNLLSRQHDTLSTDFLFHSILDVSKIKDFNYKIEKSIFSQKKNN
ncbi:phosphoethanolamine transferase [uncultured Polaribacter sp.]|uniref:phosphoethanolamine transferase n=1 Tax=uncultured Polaribacter sp. TaxID=174711 RepID=UPI002624B339|nr:phosphoethanolamine transferase [uncultured Polaribacter sp.]